MSCKQRIEYLCWERWGTVAFLVYCVSTIFMIFFSISAIVIWPSPWNRLSILVACLLPLLLVLAWKVPRLIMDKKLEKKLLFIPIIIALGILNIVFSEDQSTTLKVMVLFLISGIGIFAATSYLLTTKFRQKIFYGYAGRFSWPFVFMEPWSTSIRNQSYYFHSIQFPLALC